MPKEVNGLCFPTCSEKFKYNSRMQSTFTWRILLNPKLQRINKRVLSSLRHFRSSKRQKETKQEDIKSNNYQVMKLLKGIHIIFTVFRN